MRQFDFYLGAQIHGADGHCGKLAGLVIKPEHQQVTDLIVNKGFLLPQKHILPLSLVQNTQNNQVRLSVSNQDLNQYPVYKGIKHEEPTTGLGHLTTEMTIPYGSYGTLEPAVPTIQQKIHKGFGPDKKAIEQGIPVNNWESMMGKLVRVVVNCAQKTISYLVVQRGMIFSERIVIPNSMIERISENDILVNGTNETLAHLPRYSQVIGADSRLAR